MEFILKAYAADAAGEVGAGSLLTGLLPMVGIFAVMYLILILPQRKKEKKAKAMISAAIVGNQVVTIGGISGKIANIKDDEFTIETSIDRTKVSVKKWAIKEVVTSVES